MEQLTIQILSAIASYIFLCIFIVGIYLEKHPLNDEVEAEVYEHNKKLLSDYKSKKISAGKYSDRKKEFKKELRSAKNFHIIVAPIIAFHYGFIIIVDYINGF